MQAIILAAGMGKRLLPLTEKTPKGLIKVGEKTLTEYSVEKLLKLGINNINIVTGHEAEAFPKLLGESFPGVKINYIYNERYDTTNNSYSIWLACEAMADGFLLLNSDIIYDTYILEKMVAADASACLAIDTVKKLGDEEMKVSITDNRITAISKQVPLTEAKGEYIGIMKLDRQASALLLRHLEDSLMKRQELNIYYEDVLHYMLPEYPVVAVDTDGRPWTEIDTLEDYDFAVNKVYPAVCL
ncbi:MAG: phosphocholine cytidylyltransferase family protein [Clostridia bacterium]|nr:phosphocholine cytidylyltransferase family protein [Clostridia bacterium]